MLLATMDERVMQSHLFVPSLFLLLLPRGFGPYRVLSRCYSPQPVKFQPLTSAPSELSVVLVQVNALASHV